MGDYYTNVVPMDVEPEDAKAVADKVLHYLVSSKIVKPEVTNCTLTKEGGHAPAENYAMALATPDDAFIDLAVNGVEIVVQRSAFDSGGLEDLQCPACNQSVIDAGWEPAFQAWLGRKPDVEFTCPHCNYQGTVTTYIFEPPFVFSELGFTFWNWGDNLSEEFITKLEELTDSRIAVTFGKY